jgi:GMP synthase (glutamine-hydrolysing)
VQAFRYGEHAYGFQFHLEANRSLIERWLTVPDHQGVLADASGDIDVNEIRERCADSVGHLQALSHRTFTRWIERFELAPRIHRLPSR